MSGSTPEHTRAAYIEEFSEEAQATLPETRQTACTANTTAKRSKPEVTRFRTLRDEFSDSGYSSHTAATLGSGNSSSIESKLNPGPAPETSNVNDARYTARDAKQVLQNRAQSPERSSLRRAGSLSKGYETGRKRDCQCPECLSQKAKRPSVAINTQLPATANDAQAAQTKPSPASPRLQRDRRPYPGDAPPMQPVQARPQRTSQQYAQRIRPTSFHDGMLQQPLYTQQPVYIDRQAAVAASGYSIAPPLPPPSFPPQQPSTFPSVQTIAPALDFFLPRPSPYEAQSRASFRRVTNERPFLTRPQSTYYGDSLPAGQSISPLFDPLEAVPRQSLDRQKTTQQRLVQLPRKPFSEEDDYKRMPPPPVPTPRPSSRTYQEQRPAIRHAATTSAAYLSSKAPTKREESEYAGRHTTRQQGLEDPRPSRSRRPSVARAQLTSDEKLAAVLHLERETARMKLADNNPTAQRSRRRVSVYGHESLKDLEGSLEAAEAYQAAKSNTVGPSPGPPPSIPAPRDDNNHNDVLRLMRNKTNSDASSRISGGSRASREGSDTKFSSRRPTSDAKSRENHDSESFAMRIPRGVNVNIQPGMEGRTVSLRHSKDGEGEMELRIGERGRREGAGAQSPSTTTRPAMIRDKSRSRRYSIIEGQALVENEEPPSRTRSRNRLPEEIGREEGGRGRAVRLTTRREKDANDDGGDDGQRRLVRERIVTTSRSRRSSRSAYGGRADMNFF